MTEEQKALLRRSDFGDYYEIVINHQRTDYISGETIHKRINIGLTVVPDVQAEFPHGYEELMRYFNEKGGDYLSSVDFDNFNSLSIKFTVDHEGKTRNVSLNRESGLPDVDEYVMKLVEEMPSWIPAKDEYGNMVGQEFELVFGWPGC